MKKFCITVALCLLVSGCSNPAGRMGFDAKPPKMDDTPTIYSDSWQTLPGKKFLMKKKYPSHINPNPDSDIL